MTPWIFLASLFAPRPLPVARSTGTGPNLRDMSAFPAVCTEPDYDLNPPPTVLYRLASHAAELGEFEAAADFLIRASAKR